MYNFVKLKYFNIKKLNNMCKIYKKFKKNNIVNFNQNVKLNRYMKFETVYNEKYMTINFVVFNKINEML